MQSSLFIYSTYSINCNINYAVHSSFTVLNNGKDQLTSVIALFVFVRPDLTWSDTSLSISPPLRSATAPTPLLWWQCSATGALSRMEAMPTQPWIMVPTTGSPARLSMSATWAVTCRIIGMFCFKTFILLAPSSSVKLNCTVFTIRAAKTKCFRFLSVLFIPSSPLSLLHLLSDLFITFLWDKIKRAKTTLTCIVFRLSSEKDERHKNTLYCILYSYCRSVDVVAHW